MGGWTRIGFVLSIVWALAGGLWGNNLALDDAARHTSAQLDVCVSKNKALFHSRGDDSEPYDKIWKPCWAEFDRNFMANADGHWWAAVIVGLVPIPIAWLIVYALVSIWRWIRRGFDNAAA